MNTGHNTNGHNDPQEQGFDFGPVALDEFRELVQVNASLACFLALAHEHSNPLKLDGILIIIKTNPLVNWEVTEAEVFDGLIALGKVGLAYRASADAWTLTDKGESWADWLASRLYNPIGDQPASSIPTGEAWFLTPKGYALMGKLLGR